MIDVERKRARQREWVRRKRASDPAYAERERRRHRAYRQTVAGYVAGVRAGINRRRRAWEAGD